MIRDRKLLRSVADGRVRRLFTMAKDRTLKSRGSDALAKRYVGIAESMIRHYRIPSGRSMKNEVCSGCKSVLIPGVNCSVRLASSYGYIVYRCKCGEEKHVFYRKNMEIGRKLPGPKFPY
ncbi:MAG: ribonuclease P Rpr2/Rpp21/SNM1 subunit family protein [Candidatus Micrarchaeaceae archaeon]